MEERGKEKEKEISMEKEEGKVNETGELAAGFGIFMNAHSPLNSRTNKAQTNNLFLGPFLCAYIMH